jgi:amino acid permease
MSVALLPLMYKAYTQRSDEFRESLVSEEEDPKKKIVTFNLSFDNTKENGKKVAKESEANSSWFGSLVFLIIFLLNIMITVYAFYLAFKCVRSGKNAVVHFLGACCCSLLYIAYALMEKCTGVPPTIMM